VKTSELDYYISRFILPRFERRHDVAGAPFQIGELVKVLNDPLGDETFDKTFVGKVGKVTFFEYDAGCGQSYPFDPMIGVEFENNVVEEFWKEELSKSWLELSILTFCQKFHYPSIT
jgi:hypothetical protein